MIPFLCHFPTSFLYTAEPAQALALNDLCLLYGQGPHCCASGSATCPDIGCMKCFHHCRHKLVKAHHRENIPFVFLHFTKSYSSI